MKKIGIPRALLYYYDETLWLEFFKNLHIQTVISDKSNKKILSDGEKIANSEACLSLKMYLGHIKNLENKCDYVLVPRLFSIKKHEHVCTNFNALYDIVNNLFSIEILNYNVDLTTKDYKLMGFLKMGEELGFSYIKSYQAYKLALKKAKEERVKKELMQQKKLETDNLKILLAGHPYNLYDELIGKQVIKFLQDSNITIIYSDRIDNNIIDSQCNMLSTDIHWTHNKEVMASINYYKDKVDGIILLSAFPCGPDSLSNELIVRKVKEIPILTLIFEDLNSEVGIITRLESFIDIIKNLKEEKYAKNN